jgi:hypothetical protein
MRLRVIPIPERATRSLLCQITKRVSDELDGGGGVGREYEVVVLRVGAQEGERFCADGGDGCRGEVSGGVGGVGVAVEVGEEEVCGAVQGGAGVDCCAAVVEVGSWSGS